MLYTDSAVAGEAAGIGMGLLLAGSGSDKAAEMLAYAHDTQHEKIIRGEEREGYEALLSSVFTIRPSLHTTSSALNSSLPPPPPQAL